MDIKEFINDKFGSVRVIDNDGSEWFVGVDVARCLGYKDPKQAVRDHVKKKHKTKCVIHTPGSNYKSNTSIIDFPGLCKLVMHSKLPDAEEFQDWICEEVLPSIRETGGYLDPDRKEVRAMITESRTALTSVVMSLITNTDITYEQTNYFVRRLSIIANIMAGLPVGKDLRDEATTEQMIKINFAESSFIKTISKQIRKYNRDKKPINLSKLIDKCEEDAFKRMRSVKFKINPVSVTVI